MVTKFPSDFAIFFPSTCRKPLCIQYRAISGVPCAQRDCAISFSWCGKTRSMPPPWMSNVSPSSAPDMAEHSMCQPGPPCPPRRRPRRFARLRRLPQHEVHRVALVGRDLDARAGDHLVERAAREFPVFRKRGDVEEHVPFRGIGVALLHQLRDQPDHVLRLVGAVDVLGRARLVGWRQAAERRHVLVELLFRRLGDFPDRLVQRQIGIFLRRAPLILSSTSVMLRT